MIRTAFAPGSAAGFWTEFAARYYGREPFEADSIPVDLAVSADEMFRLLLRSAADQGSGPKDPHIRFHIGQRQVIADIADYLPVLDDGSLNGYLARLEQRLAGEPYLLVVERAHVSSRPVWQTAARFLAGLYDATGVMPRSVDVEAFVGRYPHTIPGIHREGSGVFVSMIQGAKDILVWPPDATGLPLGTARYQDARGSARRLRCAPGRLVYWPARHWHVGESPAHSSVGLHIAVLDEPLSIQDLLAETADDLGTAIDSGIGPGWSVAGAHDLGLPANLDSAAESVASAYGDPAVVRDKLIVGWLRRRTGLGFTAVPPSRKVLLSPDHVVRRDGVHPIVIASRDSATSWLAADGRVGYARSAPGLAKLVDWLNTGQPVSVRAAIDLADAAPDRDVLAKALAMLADWQAVAVIGRVQRASEGRLRTRPA